MTFYTSIAAIVSTFLATILTDKLKDRKFLKAFAVALIAGVGVLAVSYYENVALKEKSNPNINVQTNIAYNILNIKVKNDNPSLDRVVLEFHLPAHITNVEKIHPYADAKSAVFVEGEQTTEYLSNRLEIVIEDAKPNFELSFNVHLKAIPWPKINFIDRDFYCVTKIWKYKGEKQYATEWRLLSKDVPCEIPRARLSSIRMKGDMKEGSMSFNIKPLRKAKPSENNQQIIWIEDSIKMPLTINEQEDFGPIRRKEF